MCEINEELLDAPESINGAPYDAWFIKVKEVSERLLRHHIYLKFSGYEKFYSSPISCDIALELDDVILNIDVKTIDKIGNSGELNSTQFEHNQTSFLNEKVLKSGPFPGFSVKSNLQSIDPRTHKPLLTYLIKIGYSDDGKGIFNFINSSDSCIHNLPQLSF